MFKINTKELTQEKQIKWIYLHRNRNSGEQNFNWVNIKKMLRKKNIKLIFESFVDKIELISLFKIRYIQLQYQQIW